MVKEIEVEIAPHGLKGTLAIPPSADSDDNYLGKGLAPATTKCALILHGQLGHRNYCYQRQLAHRLARDLGVYLLRIDFRGCGESPDGPEPRTRGRVLEHDIEDIEHSARFLVDAARNPLKINLTLLLVIAHLRGAVAMFLWAMQQSELLLGGGGSGRQPIVVPNLVNCLSRYNSATVFDRYPATDDGNFDGVDQTCLRYGKFQKVFVPKAEVVLLALPDLLVLLQLTTELSVLSIYGLDDHIIPIEDLALFANALNRGPQLHHLKLIAGADHNFYGLEVIRTESDQEEHNPDNLPLTSKGLVNYNPRVVDYILDWLSPPREFERFRVASDTIGHVMRWPRIEGILNFRDIGGWNVTRPPQGVALAGLLPSDVYVRPRVMYRCANTANVTPAGLLSMQKLGVKVMFDLRSDGECRKDGVPADLERYGIARVHAPCFTATDYSPQAIAMRYTNLMTLWHTYVFVYDKLLSEATATFKQIFEFVRDEPGKGFVFHCTAGKDRTGVLTMLILLFAGVDKHTVAKEYELTTFGLQPDHDAIRDKFVATIDKVKAKLREAGSLMNYEDEIRLGRPNWTIERDGFQNLISSRYEAMLSTIELLDTKYGGVVAYLTNWLHLTNDDLVRIYKNLVHVGADARFEHVLFVAWDHRPSKI